MALPNKMTRLCAPAMLYFFVSVICLVLAAIQNMQNNKKYHLGSFSCNVPSCAAIFIFKIIYIIFWTWILNLMCKDGHSGVAWFLILIPFILFFLLIAMVMMNQKTTVVYKKRVKEQRYN